MKHKFMNRHELTEEEFNQLKRVPHYKQHFKPDVYGFVAAYLPRIYKFIEGKKADESLYLALKVTKTDDDTEEVSGNTDYIREAVNYDGLQVFISSRIAKKLESSRIHDMNTKPGYRRRDR